MLDYSTCKSLKDAGFPQIGYGDNYIRPDGKTHDEIYDEMDDNHIALEHQYVEIKKDDCYIPTLSELIEECGDNINFITRMKSGIRLNYWITSGIYGVQSKPLEAKGKTIKISVANFYLKLNSK